MKLVSLPVEQLRRYAVFAWRERDGKGGFDHFKNAFESLEEAVKLAENFKTEINRIDRVQVIDLLTFTEIKNFC